MSPLSCDVPVLSILTVRYVMQLKIKKNKNKTFYCHSAAQLRMLILFFLSPENYRLQSAYENNLIIKMVFVSHASYSSV